MKVSKLCTQVPLKDLKMFSLKERSDQPKNKDQMEDLILHVTSVMVRTKCGKRGRRKRACTLENVPLSASKAQLTDTTA